MNQKTDGAMEISFVLRRLLMILTLLTLVLVFVTERHHEKGMQVSTGFQFTLYPWLQASMITVAHGLDLFSGRLPNPPTASQHCSMLVGILLSFVIAPACLMFGWRHTLLKKQAGASVPPLATLAFIAGGVLAIAVAFPSVPFAVESLGRYKTVRQAQDLGSHRDHLMYRLTIIGREAREYRILPLSAGGGNGSFEAFTIREDLRDSDDGLYEVAEAGKDKLILKANSKLRPSSTVLLSINAAGAVRYSVEGL